VTALSRAIADPTPVDGLAARSPMAGLDRRSLGYVSTDENGVSRRLPDEGDRLVAFSAVHIGDNNLGAFAGKF